MAMGMMIPGMVAGWLQEQLGYNNFFILVCLLCAVTVAVCCTIKLDRPQLKKSDNHE
jgi:PAT family beta-lactamase induction signal transducer AmpG